MGVQEDKARSRRERIERLRRRLTHVQHNDAAVRLLRDVLKGVLDLLEDEL